MKEALYSPIYSAAPNLDTGGQPISEMNLAETLLEAFIYFQMTLRETRWHEIR